MNHYTIVHQSDWNRALHCTVFRNYLEPCFCVSLELDITNFLTRSKAEGYSFTLAMVYAVSKCANAIEAFRYRFLENHVVLFEQIDTAFTYLHAETELFKVVNVPMCKTMREYVTLAAKTAKEQQDYFTGPLGNDVFQFSAMPWVSYTHISHTISGKKDSATPLFDWGKYLKRDGNVILPFSVQAHHSFVDGIHIGKLVNALQDYLDKF